jgi:hypothetical protein
VHPRLALDSILLFLLNSVPTIKNLKHYAILSLPNKFGI